MIVLPADEDPPTAVPAPARVDGSTDIGSPEGDGVRRWIDRIDRMPLTDLAQRGWVHYARGHGLAELLDDVCAEAGFQARPAVRTEQTAAAPLLTAAGVGPAVVPAHLLPPGVEGRVPRPDPPVQRTLAAYTRPHPDPFTTPSSTPSRPWRACSPRGRAVSEGGECGLADRTADLQGAVGLAQGGCVDRAEVPRGGAAEGAGVVEDDIDRFGQSEEGAVLQGASRG
ncbi:LysR family transcriptional regulator substrate-binding protein [Streptomyces actuosus]|uniref:LysR family transcriptional regulator substrate-binding protein n=1 Tax=Streptomyces actuosus TaxID=1885 RepID=UPI0027DA0009|nr:LysR family transcriptional regulator substrate-binding protein [Streptomyces actuosus]